MPTYLRTRVVLSRLGRIFAVVVGIAGCVDSRSENQWRSIPIVVEKNDHVAGFLYRSRVQAGSLPVLDYRTSLKVSEDGRPLPLRVDDSTTVALLGNGRFGISTFDADGPGPVDIWISSSDNSNPSTNGRRYTVEYRKTAEAAGLDTVLVIALGLLIVLGAYSQKAFRYWLKSRFDINIRSAPALLVLTGCIALSQSGTPLSLRYSIPIDTDRLIHSVDGMTYRLPRWVSKYSSAQHGRLVDGGDPLRWLPMSMWDDSGKSGTFSVQPVTPVVLHFRTIEQVGVSGNNRNLRFETPLIPPELARLLGQILLALAILAILVRTAASSAAPSASRPEGVQVQGGWARWLLLVSLIGAAKIWAIQSHGIVTELHDAADYAGLATELVWTHYQLPNHPGGFPFVAGIAARLGIPWRLAVECLYLAACLFLADAVRRIVKSNAAASLLFAAMAWNPWTFAAFDEFMPYSFLAVLNIALMALILRLLPARSSEWRVSSFLAVGAILFMWEWSRPEGLLVYATYLLAVAALWILSSREEPRSNAARRVALLLIPLITLYLLSSSVLTVNYWKFGIAGSSQISEPGVVSLMKALYRVRPDEELRYAPVTRQSLGTSVGASPTLRLFSAKLLDPSNGQVSHGEPITGRRGEFGPWLIWLLISSVTQGDAEGSRTRLSGAAEVNAAIASGRLPGRMSLYPLDPVWQEWVPSLGAEFAEAIAAAIDTGPFAYGDPASTPALDSLFSRAALRSVAVAGSARQLPDRLASYLAVPLWALIVVAAAILAFRRYEHDRRLLKSALIISGGCVALRAALFAVFEANWGVDSTRYMRLQSPLVALPLLIAALLVAGSAATMLRNSRKAAVRD